MKVLIVGGGGREHAIAWKCSQSKRVTELYAAPGNAGIAQLATCVDISVMDAEKLVAFAKEKEIDLAIVGPDDPLVAGVADAFMDAGIRVFGPRANAAIIEGSKAFSKDLMKKYGIPSAAYETFDNADAALAYLETAKMPIVLKADGLALGKGVLICNTLEEAKEGVKTLMLDKQFGSAGDKIVIEEFMTGREVSVLCFCDGTHIKPMASAQDHKRAKDGDQGLNTGGMGTFSPSPFYTDDVDKFCKEHVYQKTMDAMKAEGRDFTGILFCGLMLTPDGPRVLEYNARFGDPEAQVVLPRMKNDIIDVMEACIDGKLDRPSPRVPLGKIDPRPQPSRPDTQARPCASHLWLASLDHNSRKPSALAAYLRLSVIMSHRSPCVADRRRSHPHIRRVPCIRLEALLLPCQQRTAHFRCH